MKVLVLPFMLLSLAAGTVGVIKTVEMMESAAHTVALVTWG